MTSHLPDFRRHIARIRALIWDGACIECGEEGEPSDRLCPTCRERLEEPDIYDFDDLGEFERVRMRNYYANNGD